MCDELTAADDRNRLAGKGMTRREFAASGAATALAAYASRAAAAQAELSEAMVEVTTPDGRADGFFVHPAKGRHPGVVFWPDALGLRDAKKAMARRLAAEGFAVLVVNPYYRNLRAPLDMTFADLLTPEGRQKIAPYMPALTPDVISRDGSAHIAFLDAQAVVDRERGIGVQGYCFAGPFAVRTAAAASGRVKACATFHGGGLVTNKPDSPHLLFSRTAAEFLIAIARNDDQKAPGEKDVLRAAASAAKRPAEIEVYAGDHGWCVPDAPSYDQPESDRAWTRLLAHYARL